jgi:hypothetical protein
MDKITLATEQPFQRPTTTAITKVQQAATAFHNGEMTKSADLFLDSWRILKSEHESQSCERFDSLQQVSDRLYYKKNWSGLELGGPPRWPQTYQAILKELGFENKRRILYGLFILHDLSMACIVNGDNYKDENGNCKLEALYAIHDGWLDNTTTETLRSPRQKADIAKMTMDPLGSSLAQAVSFKDAANVIAHFCCFHASCLAEQEVKHFIGWRLIQSNLPWIITITTRNEAWIKRKALETLIEAATQSYMEGNEVVPERNMNPWILEFIVAAQKNPLDVMLLKVSDETSETGQDSEVDCDKGQ